MVVEKAVITGNFDIIHPGYVQLFEQLNECSNIQIIMLHTDPSIERPEKLKPILSVEERKNILKQFFIRPIFITFTTEDELYFLLQSVKPDLRLIGEDYVGKPFTGDDLDIPLKYVSRDHGWSTTKFKTLISNTINDA